MLAIFSYLLLCALVAHSATGRGRWTLGYFLLSIFLSPLVGIVVLLLAGKKFHGGYTLPEREPYELAVTKRQQSYLWKLGVHDEHLLDTIGRDQASSLIDQLKDSRSPNQAPAFTLAVIVLGVGGLYIYEVVKKKNAAEAEAPLAEEVSPPQSPILQTASIKNTQDAQRIALERFPNVGVAGSRLNRDFLARVEQLKASNPALFKDPAWPLALAEECDRALRPGTTAQR